MITLYPVNAIYSSELGTTRVHWESQDGSHRFVTSSLVACMSEGKEPTAETMLWAADEHFNLVDCDVNGTENMLPAADMHSEVVAKAGFLPAFSVSLAV